MESNFDSRELANALLSLGSNKQTLQTNDSYHKPRYIPMSASSMPNFDSTSQATSFSNGWVGNSPIFGYPYSPYPMNHFPICSCIPRVSPEFSGWKPYQQNRLSSFNSFNSNTHQSQPFRYPQPLHHPLLFAQSPLQSNLQNFNKLDSNPYVTDVPPVRVQGHDEQYGIALEHQQSLGIKPGKYGTDRLPHILKKESPDEASLTVVGPVLVDFSQKSKVQGIPVLCNVSQWLSLPSYERNRLITTHTKSANNSVEGNHLQSANNANTTMESFMSLKVGKDPISQLGEAANMILQNDDARSSEIPPKQQFYGNGLKPVELQGFSSPLVKYEKNLSCLSNGNMSGSISEPRSYNGISRMKIPGVKNLKNRTCPYCHKIFARPFTLKSHIRRHTKEKPYTCVVCQRSFSQSATLENHKLTHTGVKPHQCHLCLKRFAHQTSLKTHLRIHSGEQPYQCELCLRKFTDGSTLQKHKRTHSGDKPFQCQYCLKCFSQSGNMKRHMTTTHKSFMAIQQQKDSCNTTKHPDHYLPMQQDGDI